MRRRKLESIAKRNNLKVIDSSLSGHAVIELHGREEDLEQVRPLIEDDYLVNQEGSMMTLCSDRRVRWDKLGY